jgi:hypothetical protein
MVTNPCLFASLLQFYNLSFNFFIEFISSWKISLYTFQSLVYCLSFISYLERVSLSIIIKQCSYVGGFIFCFNFLSIWNLFNVSWDTVIQLCSFHMTSLLYTKYLLSNYLLLLGLEFQFGHI